MEVQSGKRPNFWERGSRESRRARFVIHPLCHSTVLAFARFGIRSVWHSLGLAFARFGIHSEAEIFTRCVGSTAFRRNLSEVNRMNP